ncbi:MAG TPA: carbamoyl-phosphate synthase large subunit [Armatimonadetes bacterium]|nr:carbamoyl-phosphate synthase large subunit [Armatimonadota bacterium]
MPRRTDVEKILIIGSGPIIIGQACEFDYSGTQACKALKEEGYYIILVNSNPATIMTDPEFADRTYIEPITPEFVEKIIAAERPDVLLPTLGGQTGLNVAAQLAQRGVLDHYGVELIGAKYEAIRKAEDRDEFKRAMARIGLDLPRSGYVHNLEEGLRIADELGFPLVLRPSFTLGGTGGGIAYNREEFQDLLQRGLDASLVHTVLVEEAVIGWKEYELEVMRDLADNVVIICSIENFDPMGVHTGDSITVAPAQTLTDREYQRMRDAAIKVIREIGVETGGSNIQFAVHPETGRMVIIEMNPRVSRSSALASKATGFPIAKIAAKLAVGYTLDEIPNDITRETPASFEPTIDYCVVKIPRWAFEKFPGADPTLGTQMKSVGEVMAIGRTFKEALQKGLRSLEIGRYGLGADGNDNFSPPPDRFELRRRLRIPSPERLFYLHYAFCAGMSRDELHQLTKIDPWFLHNLQEIVEMEQRLRKIGARRPFEQDNPAAHLPLEVLKEAKRFGFSDRQLAHLFHTTEMTIRKFRQAHGIRATFKLVDTCAAEFEAYTPYYYSTYEMEDEARCSERPKIMILGSGPNRIGQGIEFDYCCVHAALALKEEGYETIMVNSNPETVSTDYDTSDLLYFEPLTCEDVLNIVDRLKPDGVIVQFGGQTPLNISLDLWRAGVPIIGTSPESIARAEDREQFKQLLDKLDLQQPANATAVTVEDVPKVAAQIGYPIVVRPSFVLGGGFMEIIYGRTELDQYLQRLQAALGGLVQVDEEHPILIDKFLEDAIEIDVDAISDGKRVVIGGIMEHIEEAGIHSGDSTCVLPPHTLVRRQIEDLKEQTRMLAQELNVVGLLNIQYAIKGSTIYVLEVNPRASRTVPFVSKAIGVPLAKLAARVMVGRTLEELGFTKEVEVEHFSVKEPVFPFIKFPGVDAVLGPEMRSTGEVMGIDPSFGRAFTKAYEASGQTLPLSGTVFISVKNSDKRGIILVAQQFQNLGFEIVATEGTGGILRNNDVQVRQLLKVSEGRPNVLDLLKNGDLDLLIDTPSGDEAKADHHLIRKEAVRRGIPLITTLAAATAAVQGITQLRAAEAGVKALQEYHMTAKNEPSGTRPYHHQ